MKYNIAIGDKKFETEVGEIRNDGVARIIVNGKPYEVMIENYAQVSGGQAAAVQYSPAPSPAVSPAPAAPAPATPPPPKPSAPVGSGTLTAPIPGLVLEVMVKMGDAVDVGDTVAIMEAMKMENPIVSNISGTVKDVRVQKGSEVATGDVIMIIE